MQDYLTGTRLGGALDTVGKRALLLVLAISLFTVCWGLRVQTVLAGLALFALFWMLSLRSEKRALRRRERALRIRIGGELALERLLLEPPRRAHFEAAMLYMTKHPCMLMKTGDDGVLCKTEDGELMLAACSRTHAKLAYTAQDVLALQRACRAHGASRGVVLLTGTADANAREQAMLPPCVDFVPRSAFVLLAGRSAPATDEQLLHLKKRRGNRQTASKWMRHVLSPTRAPRLARYALGLLALFLLTGAKAYLAPALLCLLLMTLCRLTGTDAWPRVTACFRRARRA